MLLDFEGLFDAALAGHVELNGERVVNRGELVGELDVHHRSDDLNDFSFVHALMI